MKLMPTLTLCQNLLLCNFTESSFAKTSATLGIFHLFGLTFTMCLQTVVSASAKGNSLPISFCFGFCLLAVSEIPSKSFAKNFEMANGRLLSRFFLIAFLCIFAGFNLVDGSNPSRNLNVPQMKHGAFCKELRSGQRVYFDMVYQILLECSTDTCIGDLKACQRCCNEPSNVNPKKLATQSYFKDIGNDDDRGSYASPRRSPSFSPETDPVFLGLTGTIAVLVLCTIVTAATLYCKARMHRNSGSAYTLTNTIEEGKEKSSCEKVPPVWSKLSGRSCKVYPKCKMDLQSGKQNSSAENPASKKDFETV